ncbi:MAG: RNB domain-containing ribonuclease, partial [Opitutales bacterium]|nr:RNB domain-containing ribonuclease [Opitutales bacterium]
TYLTGTVIPMLPFPLSNGICSLVEDQDRLVKSVFLSYDASGDCKKVTFANSVIKSNKRLSYEQAYALMTSDDLAVARAIKPPETYETAFTGKSLSDISDKELNRIRTAIRRLWSIASTLRKKRMRKGALDLEVPEFKIFCNAEGYAERIEKIVSDESHQLIEEFMLAANEAVARELFGNHIPYISRVHDNPDEEKLNELRDELELFGIYCGDLSSRREIIKVLAEISKHPQSYILKTKFLRSLKRAQYRASADGHFGLSKQYYAHFTSPIRRYADLTVHRNMAFLMKARNMPFAQKNLEQLIAKSVLDKTAEHITRTEQNSAEAERESRKIKLIEYFQRSVNTNNSFDAIITSVSNHGFFVELTESMAFGFVHIHTLRDDIYRLNNNATELRGRQTNQAFKVGDKIKLRVESVDIFKRQIDFAPAVDLKTSSKRTKKRKNKR